jgi:hypothetical protein
MFDLTVDREVAGSALIFHFQRYASTIFGELGVVPTMSVSGTTCRFIFSQPVWSVAGNLVPGRLLLDEFAPDLISEAMQASQGLRQRSLYTFDRIVRRRKLQIRCSSRLNC